MNSFLRTKAPVLGLSAPEMALFASWRLILSIFHTHRFGSFHLNGFIVISFCGLEGNVNINGFHVVKRGKIANHGMDSDYSCIKSI